MAVHLGPAPETRNRSLTPGLVVSRKWWKFEKAA
jgi:hypothetical protein